MRSRVALLEVFLMSGLVLLSRGSGASGRGGNDASASSEPAACVCGDGVVNTPCGEECDNGGICIGGANAGATCVRSSDCPDGGCQPFGGDGCAANCTVEADVVFDLVPGDIGGPPPSPLKQTTSGLTLHASIFNIPLPATGSLTLTVGKQRDGQIPLVVKATTPQLPRIQVPGLVCECIRAVAAETCGGTLFEADGVTPSPDCTPGYTAGESVCAGKSPCAFVHGPGNSAAGVIGCDGLSGVDFSIAQDHSDLDQQPCTSAAECTSGSCVPASPSVGGMACGAFPPVITVSGLGGAGSAALFNSITVSTASSARCSDLSPDYGEDGEFCTDDDPQNVRGVSLLTRMVTGVATGDLTGANGEDVRIGPLSVAGTPFDCRALAGSTPSVAGAALASVFPQLGRPQSGDVLFTSLFVAPGGCTGDCDNSGRVTVDELVQLVNIALGDADLAACARGNRNHDRNISVDELVTAVNHGLSGCPT